MNSDTGLSSSAIRSSVARGTPYVWLKSGKTTANPLDLYAIPRPKSVPRFKDQIRNLTRTKGAG